MNGRWTLLTMLILSVGLAGCQGLAPPDFAHPGSAQYQRSRAHRYDPYPENESGPEVVGARPLEYEKPPAEVGRARWTIPNRGR